MFLQSMIHVSTAYSNCHLPEIYEELYPAPIDPGRLIQLTEWLSDPILESLTPSLVEPRPNTYTYTKALAEHLLVNDGGNLPICVVRPAIGKFISQFIILCIIVIRCYVFPSISKEKIYSSSV